MTDPERDTRVSQHYRALGREEPPPGIDAAILAAARRRRSRWAVPVSIAAVVVLAVGVTLRVQMEERRGADEVVLSPQVMQTPPPAAAPARKAARDAAPLLQSEPARPEAKREMRSMQAPASPTVAASPQAREAPAPVAASALSGRLRSATPADEAASGVAAGKISAAPQTPEQWLERIAELRKAGRDREADRSLAEFRKRYPDYRMSEAMRARVAPR